MKQPIFSAASMLLPPSTAMENWCVVACDQYTSEPAYWERVAKRVGELPSALHCILPEVYFASETDFTGRIAQINNRMGQYLASELLETPNPCYILLARTLRDGRRRLGLMGKIDLDAYSYQPDTYPAVRPTEGTVESRLPPRIRVREHAPIELPHVMMLLNDSQKTVLEPVFQTLTDAQRLYDLDLMEDGGHLSGWALSKAQEAEIDCALEALFSQTPQDDGHPMQIAVGDGNHSLATAKACYEALKKQLTPAQVAQHPARWALVELGNLHDDALVFEPIHRIVTGVSVPQLLQAMQTAFSSDTPATPEDQSFSYIIGDKEAVLSIQKPTSRLAVGSLQSFLDAYLAQNGGEIDYIHGADVVRTLATQPNAIGFLLPVMAKEELFAAVRTDGALPRKTFSMGEAWDKRYYLEARRIR